MRCRSTPLLLAFTLLACRSGRIACPMVCQQCLDPVTDPDAGTTQLQQALDMASATAPVCLRPGTYAIRQTLRLTVPYSSLAGLTDSAGNGAILDFGAAVQDAGVDAGANATREDPGLLVTAVGVVVQDLTLQSSWGDAVRVENTSSCAVRRVRVLWPASTPAPAGASGISVRGSHLVNVEDSDVTGATGAGVEVRASYDVSVRVVRVDHSNVGVAALNPGSPSGDGGVAGDAGDGSVASVDFAGVLSRYNSVGFAALRVPELSASGSDRVLLRDSTIRDDCVEQQGSGTTRWRSLQRSTAAIIAGASLVQLRNVSFSEAGRPPRVLVGTLATATGAMPADAAPYPSEVYLDGCLFRGVEPTEPTNCTGPTTGEILQWDGLGGASTSAVCVSAGTALTFRNTNLTDPAATSQQGLACAPSSTLAAQPTFPP